MEHQCQDCAQGPFTSVAKLTTHKNGTTCPGKLPSLMVDLKNIPSVSASSSDDADVHNARYAPLIDEHGAAITCRLCHLAFHANSTESG